MSALPSAQRQESDVQSGPSEIVAAQPLRLTVRGKIVLVSTLVGALLIPPAIQLAVNGRNHWDASTGGADFARRILTWADAETAKDLFVLEATKGRDDLTRAQRYELAADGSESLSLVESFSDEHRAQLVREAAELRALATAK